MNFIEAWTDHDGYLPMDPGDYWAEGNTVKRLSTSVPGLGNQGGDIQPKSEAMRSAAAVFDGTFAAPYWSEKHHKVGPFTSMLDDISGGSLSFWRGWTKRAIEHIGSNVLDGCKPPAETGH
jgi:hypothetical protein